MTAGEQFVVLTVTDARKGATTCTYTDRSDVATETDTEGCVISYDCFEMGTEVNHMVLKHRLLFKENQTNIDVLKAAKLPFNTSVGLLEVYVLDNDLPKIGEILPFALVDDITKKYTKEELKAAAWLVVRPAWQQYYAVNEEKSFKCPCSACSSNQQQIGTILVKTDIKRIKRPFLKLIGINEILVDAKLVPLFAISGLQGFAFQKVHIGNTGRELASLVQLRVEEILPQAIINPYADYKHLWECPCCKTKHGILKPEIEIRLDKSIMTRQNKDIYKTYEQFGQNVIGRKFIISNSFYKFLLSNNLHGGVIVDSICRE